MVKLVSQNTFLWNKSIKENIIYPNQVDESFNIEKYKKCIEITQLTNYIDSLPKKTKPFWEILARKFPEAKPKGYR